ncbi:hypothetical protein [Nitrosomonas sp. wSCUT-2]
MKKKNLLFVVVAYITYLPTNGGFPYLHALDDSNREELRIEVDVSLSSRMCCTCLGEDH